MYQLQKSSGEASAFSATDYPPHIVLQAADR